MAKLSDNPKKPKFVREEPEVRRKLLIEATLRCLAKYGYGGTTVEVICKAAKVSRGLLNHHFNGKSDIIVQAYEYMSDKLDNSTRSLIEEIGSEPQAQLEAMIKAAFSPPTFTKEDLSIWISLWNLAQVDPQINGLNKRHYNKYRRSIAQLIDAVADEKQVTINSSRAALSLTALMDGLWLEWCLDPDAFVPQEGEAACLDFIKRLFT